MNSHHKKIVRSFDIDKNFSMARNYDFVVVGAGIVGTAIALELKMRFPKAKLAVLEKEKFAGYHSSGRNSGVLHAGFYYTANSLKARFTAQGNAYLKDYCLTKKLRVLNCGKLVVAKNQEDLNQFPVLLDRAKSNAVELHEIGLNEARKIEPRVKTHLKALWSPATATVDPLEVLNAFMEDAQKQGIDFYFETEFVSANDNVFVLKGETFSAGFIINAAGLYADSIARKFGFSKRFRILPFKGLYLYSKETSNLFKTHIYPVPNLKNPFLGVHHTLSLNGQSKIGPTAIPAFWREQYEGFSRFSWLEFLEILRDEVSLFFSANFDFRSLALEEIKKYHRPRLVAESATMAEGVELQNYVKWGRPGIRAQLFNIEERKLEMDFCFEGDKRSLHILNAVSPAFTCSVPFAQYVVNHLNSL